MELKGFDDTSSALPVGPKPSLRATDYGSITADNQQDILLRRRRKAIAVFERDMLSTIESNQRLEAKRFLNNLKRSEMLLKEHESTKRSFFARHTKRPPVKEDSPEVSEDKKTPKSSNSSFSGSMLNQSKTTRTHDDIQQNRAFSGKLRQLNDKIEVPYIKLNSYTKADLKRPSTSLELKRKAWEKVSKHLEETRSLRPASAGFIAKCEGSVPRDVRKAREKLRELTKVRLLSQLPPAPPRIDVEKVQKERRETERIEKEVVGEFCLSLGQLKVILPPKFCWMDVNEVYSRNAEVQKRNNTISSSSDWEILRQEQRRQKQAQNEIRNDCDVKIRRRRKGR